MKVFNSEKSLTPLLKWAGGKRWFVHRFFHELSALKNFRWVEPFAGGLAVSLAIEPKKVLANDINPHLINLYQHIKEGAFKFPQEYCFSKEYYYKTRSQFNELIEQGKINTIESAQLFWLLNRLGYNGLCRFNQKGFFNTPAGSYKKIHQPPHLDRYTSSFKNWDFSCGSFTQMDIQENDFLFCDPPYDESWQGYAQEQFSFELHQKLTQWIVEHNKPALIMNHPTKRILELYRDYGFKIHYVTAPRTIGSNPYKRKPCQEIIATHNFSWKELPKKL